MTATLTPAAERDLAKIRLGVPVDLRYGPYRQLVDAGLIEGTQQDPKPVAVRAPRIEDYQAPLAVRLKNAERVSRSGDVADECYLCGRPLTEKALASAWMVEHTTSSEIIPIGDPRSGGPESQGCFPLGSECAKRLPKTLRAKTVR